MSEQIPKSYLNMKQFLSLAIRFEVESAEYYQRMRKSTTEPKALALLEELERQEREHEQALKEWKEDRRSGQLLQFAPDFSLSMPASPRKPGFDELLEVAIERERQSVRIYRAVSEVTSGAFRELLEGLAQFEQQHEDRLVGLRLRQ
jgi:rubrerythrin